MSQGTAVRHRRQAEIHRSTAHGPAALEPMPHSIERHATQHRKGDASFRAAAQSRLRGGGCVACLAFALVVALGQINPPAEAFTQSWFGLGFGNGVPMGREWLTRLAAAMGAADAVPIVVGGDWTRCCGAVGVVELRCADSTLRDYALW